MAQVARLKHPMITAEFAPHPPPTKNLLNQFSVFSEGGADLLNFWVFEPISS